MTEGLGNECCTGPLQMLAPIHLRMHVTCKPFATWFLMRLASATKRHVLSVSEALVMLGLMEGTTTSRVLPPASRVARCCP